MRTSPDYSRRLFLQSAALTSLAAAGCAGVSPVQEKIPSGGYIDAHVHVWTPDTQRYRLAEGFTKENMVPASFTPEELFAQCRPQGVMRIVLIQMSFYRYDNRYLLDMMQSYREIFGGVGIVDESRPDAQNMMKQLAGQGIRGFRIYTEKEKAEAWSDSAGMKTMIRRLRDAYGANRLMWASDCPFQVQNGHTYADSIALIRDRLDFLSAEDKQWMLGKTAEKVFFA